MTRYLEWNTCIGFALVQFRGRPQPHIMLSKPPSLTLSSAEGRTCSFFLWSKPSNFVTAHVATKFHMFWVYCEKYVHPPRTERFPKGGDFAPQGLRDCPMAIWRAACQCFLRQDVLLILYIYYRIQVVEIKTATDCHWLPQAVTECHRLCQTGTLGKLKEW